MPTVEIAVTRAPSETPASASSVTVAGWPTFTLLMSDSLNATVIAILLVLTISANDELEELEELEPPELEADEEPAPAPAEDPPPPLEDDPVDAELDGVALVVEPAETESPARSDESDTIVPLIGA